MFAAKKTSSNVLQYNSDFFSLGQLKHSPRQHEKYKITNPALAAIYTFKPKI